MIFHLNPSAICPPFDLIENERIQHSCVWQKRCSLPCHIVVFAHKRLIAAVATDSWLLARRLYCSRAVSDALSYPFFCRTLSEELAIESTAWATQREGIAIRCSMFARVKPLHPHLVNLTLVFQPSQRGVHWKLSVLRIVAEQTLQLPPSSRRVTSFVA